MAKAAEAKTAQKPAAQSEPAAPAEQELPIEELARGADPVLHAGVCEAQGWLPGKCVTANAYQAAVDAWLRGGIDGE